MHYRYFHFYFIIIYYPIDLVDYIAKVVLILKYQNNILLFISIAITLLTKISWLTSITNKINESVKI
jgi:hypothetical protein